ESGKTDDQSSGLFQKSIVYREYAQMEGRLGIGLRLADSLEVERLIQWLANIQYLGKRGSFMQIQAMPVLAEQLPTGYIIIDGSLPEAFDLDLMLVHLDDTTASATFEHVSAHSQQTLRLGIDRALRPVALPYRVVMS